MTVSATGEAGRSFRIRLGLVALVAVALRVIYVLAFAPVPALLPDDTFWFAFVSDQIVLGHGFVIGHSALFSRGFHTVPTALHPPLYPLALAGIRELGVTNAKNLLWLGPVTGTITVVGIGLLGRAFGGPTVGLTAAGLAAVYPLLIVADGALLSETLYGPAIILVLATALVLARRPGVKWAAALGLAVGLASLVRSEALGLVVVLALPLAWRGAGGAARAVRLAVTVACSLLVIAPWVIRNEQALGTISLSTNDGITLVDVNCHDTYYGPDLGYLSGYCTPAHLTGNEAQQDATLRSRGLRYAADHLSRLPIVVAARLASMWGLFHPFRSSNDEGRNITISNIGVVFFYPLAALALAGAWALRRRRAELWVLIAPIVLATVISAATYGSLRLRYLAEPSLVLLAAVGINAWLTRRSARRAAERPAVASAG